eukprot:364731-Chlamydomonas_euryale.AAC.5
MAAAGRVRAAGMPAARRRSRSGQEMRPRAPSEAVADGCEHACLHGRLSRWLQRFECRREGCRRKGRHGRQRPLPSPRLPSPPARHPVALVVILRRPPHAPRLAAAAAVGTPPPAGQRSERAVCAMASHPFA